MLALMGDTKLAKVTMVTIQRFSPREKTLYTGPLATRSSPASASGSASSWWSADSRSESDTASSSPPPPPSSGTFVFSVLAAGSGVGPAKTPLPWGAAGPGFSADSHELPLWSAEVCSSCKPMLRTAHDGKSDTREEHKKGKERRGEERGGKTGLHERGPAGHIEEVPVATRSALQLLGPGTRKKRGDCFLHA
ncbi:hypothetical protein VTK73DRAFT_6481 [Phialemonium thermophilum]|uniref:Uncharacterized protein n=1 Tax=Phialemonium thermophilum TaxID=223376 RepID=A0ABR3UZD2_9PEZI